MVETAVISLSRAGQAGALEPLCQLRGTILAPASIAQCLSPFLLTFEPLDKVL